MPRPDVGTDSGQPVELHYQDVGAGGLDDATIEQFQQGVVTDRPAFLDGFTADFSTAGGKGLLGRTSGGVGEQQRQYALRIAEFASPEGTSTASPRPAAPTSAVTSPG